MDARPGVDMLLIHQIGSVRVGEVARLVYNVRFLDRLPLSSPSPGGSHVGLLRTSRLTENI